MNIKHDWDVSLLLLLSAEGIKKREEKGKKTVCHVYCLPSCLNLGDGQSMRYRVLILKETEE